MGSAVRQRLVWKPFLKTELSMPWDKAACRGYFRHDSDSSSLIWDECFISVNRIQVVGNLSLMEFRVEMSYVFTRNIFLLLTLVRYKCKVCITSLVLHSFYWNSYTYRGQWEHTLGHLALTVKTYMSGNNNTSLE